MNKPESAVDRLKALRSTAGLKVTRNGAHAWTVRDRATNEVLGTGNTREQAVWAANRKRLAADKEA